METPRKPRASKGETPELTKLKQLPEELQEQILAALEGDPTTNPPTRPKSLAEVRANLLLPPFEVDLSSDSQLSRWRSWYLRQRSLEQANKIAEDIALAFAEGEIAATPEQVREFQLRMLTAAADNLQSPGLMLAIAKEIRAGESAKTKADLEYRKLELAERRVKVAERKLDQLKSTLTDTKLTPEQREAKMKEVFGLA